MDVESVMFGTFGDTMLTPLEKVPIWPYIFIKYTLASVFVFALGILHVLYPIIFFILYFIFYILNILNI